MNTNVKYPNNNHKQTYQWLYDDIQQHKDQIISNRDMP